MTNRCPTCEAITVWETRGHLFTVTCPNCGMIQQGTYQPELPPLPPRMHERVSVTIVTQASAADVRALRRFIPELASLPIATFRKSLASEPRLDVGVTSRVEGLAIRRAAASFGLEVVLDEVESTADDTRRGLRFRIPIA